jgi:glycerol-3-phosphate cytidylyltransferase-like family protein
MLAPALARTLYEKHGARFEGWTITHRLPRASHERKTAFVLRVPLKKQNAVEKEIMEQVRNATLAHDDVTITSDEPLNKKQRNPRTTYYLIRLEHESKFGKEFNEQLANAMRKLSLEKKSANALKKMKKK